MCVCVWGGEEDKGLKSGVRAFAAGRGLGHGPTVPGPHAPVTVPMEGFRVKGEALHKKPFNHDGAGSTAVLRPVVRLALGRAPSNPSPHSTMPYEDPARRRAVALASVRKKRAAMTEEEKKAVQNKQNARRRERYRDEGDEFCKTSRALNRVFKIRRRTTFVPWPRTRTSGCT